MRPKTLLIEDNDAVRGVLCRAFAKAGWDVHSSATPGAAIAVASVDHFDVIVSDVYLPGMTGFQLADRLSALQPDAGVIFISGYPPDMMREAHGQRVLQKPFRTKELITLADRLVRRRPGSGDFQRLVAFDAHE
jgi:CheY-like chemotaxis protein